MSTAAMTDSTASSEDSASKVIRIETYASVVKHNWSPMVMGCASLLESGEFSDFTIVCGERIWKVHEAIISRQSKYFKSACSNAFSEAANGQIDLSCDDEPALNLLITYLYTGEFPEIKSGTPGVAPDAMLALKVHVLADKYGIDALVEIAAQEFMRIATRVPFWPEFGAWLDAVLDDTSETSSLRETMLEFLRRALCGLLDPGKNKENKQAVQSVEAALTRTPEFAVALLRNISSTLRPLVEGGQIKSHARFRVLEGEGTDWQHESRVSCGALSCGIEFSWPTGLTGDEAHCPRCAQVVPRPGAVYSGGW
nr:hypothetical protein B0A51_06838 [Rachicladosporium sp. CCFEE 5018]